MSDDSKTDKEELSVTSDLIAGLTFGPNWAQETAPSDFSRFNAKEDDVKKGRGKGRGYSQRPMTDSAKRAPGRSRSPEGQARPPFGRKQHREFQADERPLRIKESVNVPAISISLIPSQARLVAVRRFLRHSIRAYPVAHLAERFLGKNDSYHFKFEVENRADRFFQCAICGLPAADGESVEAHILKMHFDDFFDREELTGEPPTGNFVVVQKCGLSGKLLGPPNYHGTAERIHEIHRTLYSHLSDNEYRSKIENVREEAVIEQWKQECAKQTLYIPKDATGEKPRLKWVEADIYLSKNIVPDLIKTTKKAMVPAVLTDELSVREWKFRVSDMVRDEKRRPGKFIYALRAALRGMKFELVNIPGKGEHVVSIKPTLLDAEHAVQNVKNLTDRIREKPGTTRTELLGEQGESASDLPALFSWLIGKGHLIELHDGGLYLPPAN